MKTPVALGLAILLLAPGWCGAAAEDEKQEQPAHEDTGEASRGDVPIPPKLQPPPEESVPTVTIRTQDNGDRVEEYRQDGRLHMVKVIPQRGAPYFLLDTNGDGRLDSKDGEGPVAPVYWTIYEWD